MVSDSKYEQYFEKIIHLRLTFTWWNQIYNESNLVRLKKYSLLNGKTKKSPCSCREAKKDDSTIDLQVT